MTPEEIEAENIRRAALAYRAEADAANAIARAAGPAPAAPAKVDMPMTDPTGRPLQPGTAAEVGNAYAPAPFVPTQAHFDSLREQSRLMANAPRSAAPAAPAAAPAAVTWGAGKPAAPGSAEQARYAVDQALKPISAEHKARLASLDLSGVPVDFRATEAFDGPPQAPPGYTPGGTAAQYLADAEAKDAQRAATLAKSRAPAPAAAPTTAPPAAPGAAAGALQQRAAANGAPARALVKKDYLGMTQAPEQGLGRLIASTRGRGRGR